MPMSEEVRKLVRDAIETGFQQQVIARFAIYASTARDDGALNRFQAGIADLCAKRQQAMDVIDGTEA